MNDFVEQRHKDAAIGLAGIAVDAEVCGAVGKIKRRPNKKQDKKPDTCPVPLEGGILKAAGNSFPAGTLIWTEDGLKPIEEIEVGNLVWSRDENNPDGNNVLNRVCLLYTSPSPRDQRGSRMPSSA